MLTFNSVPAGEPTATATILLVEDDPDMERILRTALGLSGYQVVSAATGVQLRAFLHTTEPDLIVLDLMLPDADGLVLMTSIQRLTSAPILICSARQRQVDRVLGLRLGAADFIAKPFDLDEFEARIEALLRCTRRSQPLPSSSDEIRVRDLVIKQSHATVKIGDQPVHLTPIEYRLLVTLASQPDAVFARESLIERVWGYREGSNCGHLVDVNIGRLRLKLRSVNRDTPYIVTIRGSGYCLTAVAERDRVD